MKSFIEIKGKGRKRETEKEKERERPTCHFRRTRREWKWVELVL